MWTNSMGQHFPIAKGYTGDQFPGHEARSRAGFQEQDIQGCGLGQQRNLRPFYVT